MKINFQKTAKAAAIVAAAVVTLKVVKAVIDKVKSADADTAEEDISAGIEQGSDCPDGCECEPVDMANTRRCDCEAMG